MSIEMPCGKWIVAPSLLSADFGRLAADLERLEADADWFHFDVMDGRFVPNISIGLPVLEAVRKLTERPIDVHLMIVEPERYVEAFIKAGADILTVHVEASPHLHRTIQHIKECGGRAGVALNPHTPLSSVKEVLADVDMVLLMSVDPGFGGQRYIESCTRKISALKEICQRERLAVDIEVDGGLKLDNVLVPALAGANVLVSGSGVFGAADPAAAIRTIKQRLTAL